jgi:hypothetical protein
MRQAAPAQQFPIPRDSAWMLSTRPTTPASVHRAATLRRSCAIRAATSPGLTVYPAYCRAHSGWSFRPAYPPRLSLSSMFLNRGSLRSGSKMGSILIIGSPLQRAFSDRFNPSRALSFSQSSTFMRAVAYPLQPESGKDSSNLIDVSKNALRPPLR